MKHTGVSPDELWLAYPLNHWCMVGIFGVVPRLRDAQKTTKKCGLDTWHRFQWSDKDNSLGWLSYLKKSLMSASGTAFSVNDILVMSTAFTLADSSFLATFWYTLHGNFHEIINFIQWRSPVLSPVAIVANALPIGMEWAGSRVDANVASPVDDVTNASLIRMDWADGRVDANVANPIDDVANASPIAMDWAGGCVDANVANPVDDVANASPIGMDWADGRVNANVANPVDDVANSSPIAMDRAGGRHCWRRRQCVANRNGLSWWLRRWQCRQPRWRCCQCVAIGNGLGWWPPLLTMSPMRCQ